MKLKTCTKCKKEKPTEEFNKNCNEKDGLTCWCKECRHDYHVRWYPNNNERLVPKRKKYYQENKPTILSKCKNYRDENNIRISEDRREKISWLAEIKRKDGCSVCGYNKCVNALEYHHIDPEKKDTVGGLVSYSIKRIQEEFKDCILLCSNCHREIHWRMRNAI